MIGENQRIGITNLKMLPTRRVTSLLGMLLLPVRAIRPLKLCYAVFVHLDAETGLEMDMRMQGKEDEISPMYVVSKRP